MDLSIFDFSILGFGGFFCLVWAVGLSLLLPGSSKLIVIYFIGMSGLRLVWEAYTHSGLVTHFPKLYAFPVPFLYVIGPSILFYYEKLSGRNGFKMNPVHFIPIIFAMLPLCYWIPLEREDSVLLIHSVTNGDWKFPNAIFILWIIGPKLSILFYSLSIAMRKSGEGVLALQLLPENIRRFSLVLLVYILSMIFFDIIGYVFGIRTFYQYSAWSHSLAAILVYLYSRYNPSVMLEISTAIQSARYSKSKLVGINSKEAIQNLHRFMTKESYFAEEELRLPTMAHAMQISPHQLSELINVHFKMSFNHYINHHRILIACAMLEESKNNILSINYSVGFNSKSAFNRVFRELIGTSPREYRKNPKTFIKEKSNLLQKIEPKL
ncbi:helix-turn-helix domain-containing protein [Leptospira jelokensis]|uniref:AraC family transcriptional regulator n=1 Tax=Leptospira jelokensis TaxID=2484931 RepID=A0A4Z1A4F9_9LEPT|nr:AraC family transcriptional regulator [Leptospira jelokensis]TGL75677.1 AraC family transcriptional regulator [Leptospira jelokensis]